MEEPNEKRGSAVFPTREKNRGLKTANAHMRFVQEKLRFELQPLVRSSAPLVFSRSRKKQQTLSCFAGYAFQHTRRFGRNVIATTHFREENGGYTFSPRF